MSKLQSAYLKFHSSETALLYVQNDILASLDAGHSTALLLLDLSAAFDTIDHSILTHRLQHALSLKEPHYLNSLLINRLNSHSLRFSSFNPLTLPFFNKKSNGFRSFAHTAPFLWNLLPNTVCSAPTYLSFRKSLKTYFFNQAFPT